MSFRGLAEYFPVAAIQGRAIHIARKQGWGGRILCGTVTSSTCGNCNARYRAAMRIAAPRPTSPPDQA